MSSNKKFIIPFEGLKNGKHSFKFDITTEFFEELAYSIIQGGDVKVDFQLNKKDTMLLVILKCLVQFKNHVIDVQI